MPDPVSAADPHLIAIGHGRLIAMMAVGDDQLFFPHLCLHRRDDRRVGNPPHAVHHAILVGDLDLGPVGDEAEDEAELEAADETDDLSRASTLPASAVNIKI